MPSTAPPPHPSIAVLEKLAELALNGTLQGSVLLAAARLLCQDRWHQEKLALAEAKQALQEQKEARLAKQSRREIRLKRAQFALKIKEYKLKKQTQDRNSPQSWAQDNLPSISFAPVSPSEKMIQLKNELGIQSGGVVIDTRKGNTPNFPNGSYP